MSSTDLETVLGELRGVLQDVDAGAVRLLEERLAAARTVYVAGAGRTGLVLRAFAMRLMHLGVDVHVVGDVTTPAFQVGDLLVVGSGSGETGSLRVIAQRAKALGGVLALVTIVPTSSIGQLADVVVRLDAPSPKAAVPDTVVMRLARARGASGDEMFTRHANLE